MDKKENLRRAIDIMTAWTTDPDSLSFTGDRVKENISDGPDGEMMLMFGLISLAGTLLVRLETATGKDMQWHLQDIARKSLH